LGTKSPSGFGTEACRRQWRKQAGEASGIARSSRMLRLCEFPGSAAQRIPSVFRKNSEKIRIRREQNRKESEPQLNMAAVHLCVETIKRHIQSVAAACTARPQLDMAAVFCYASSLRAGRKKFFPSGMNLPLRCVYILSGASALPATRRAG